jgi:predicted MFS family arabinose efflux permease
VTTSSQGGATGLRQWVGRATGHARVRLESTFGGPERTRVIVLLACVLALSSADSATVGASAVELRHALGISNTDIGLLVAVNSLVAAVASLPFGVLADRVRRTRVLGLSIILWGVSMIWSATVSSFGRLLLARLFLGVVTAAAGPVVASMVGDYFPSEDRGRVYSYILTGELLGAGIGFAVTGDIAALSWRAAFVILALPTFLLAWYIFRLPEPARGGANPLPRIDDGEERSAATDPTIPMVQPDEDLGETDAQRVARQRGVRPDDSRVLRVDARGMSFLDATRYVLSIRTNVILIVASACGYFYLAGVSTFGVEYVRQQYGVEQVVANLLMLVIGFGAVIGVLLGGSLSDGLLRRHYLNARIMVSAVAALLTAALFVPAVISRSAVAALPYLTFAAFALAAQNPPIDAARLDIVPPLLWGRAEGIRTFLRTLAQALAPLAFGGLSDLLGGGRSGLEWAFLVMLLPLAANGLILLKALGTYPADVATAAAAARPDRPDL